MGWLANPPAGLEILASWPVLVVTGVFFLFEFLASKIQFMDNIWDFFHTFIRDCNQCGRESLRRQRQRGKRDRDGLAG